MYPRFYLYLFCIDTIPVGGSVRADASGDSATVTLEWEAAGQGEQENLLMMALPHHMDVISGVDETDHVVVGVSHFLSFLWEIVFFKILNFRTRSRATWLALSESSGTWRRT